MKPPPFCIPRMRRGSVRASDETNERILAHRPGQRRVSRTSRDTQSRAVDWNGPQVQLAQGRLCRTAEKRFGHISREWVFTQTCSRDEAEEKMDTQASPESDLRTALGRLGAREFEVAALTMDVHRGLAALAMAEKRGVDRPIAYAIALFDNADWHPAGESRRVATNQSVDRKCDHCGGHRFVAADVGDGLYEETYAPCSRCNAGCNTARWTIHGARLEAAAR